MRASWGGGSALRRTEFVAGAEFVRYGGEPRVGGPKLHTSGDGGGEQVHVYPAEAATVQAASADQINYLAMGNAPGLRQFLVISQEFSAAAEVTHEDFSVDQLVSGGLVAADEPGGFSAEGLTTGQ